MTWKHRRALFGAGLCCALLAGIGPACADKIKNPIAVFDGLDKITGRVISFEAAIDETVQFGSLQITPRVCYTHPATEAPRIDVFAEVDEVEEDHTYKRIFTGWMFASSPGLHGVEHPVYDIWLTDCKGGTEIIHTPPEEAEAPPEAPLPGDAGSDAAQAGALLAPTVLPKKHGTRPPANAQAPNSLDLATAPASPPIQIFPRRQPTQRYYPNDAPIPPANIPGGNILNR